MPSTTALGLPIPLDTDPLADVALAIRNLANKLDTRIGRKNNDEQLVSSTVLQNDDELWFTVEAGKVYMFEIVAVFIAGSSAVDAKVAITCPAGALMYTVLALDPSLGAGNTGSAVMGAVSVSGAATSVGVSSALTPVTIRGTVAPTAAGDVRFQWAQLVSAVAPGTTVKAGSYFRVERIS